MLRFLLRLALAFVRLLLSPLALVRRIRGVPHGAYVAIEVDGPVVDIARQPRLWEIGREQPTSLHALTELVDRVVKDDAVSGVVLTLRAFRGGMATASSLRSILTRLRATGRHVVVHLPLGAGTKELYIATGADRIYMGPQASLAPLGFSASVRYVKGALGKVGLDPEVFSRGAYKSAGEQLVRDDMSDRQREQLGAIYDVFYAHLVDGIARSRGMTNERAREIVDGAPYRADEARALGLVDGAAYEDDLPALFGGKRGRAILIDADRYLQIRRPFRLGPLFDPPVLGVIPIHGAITSELGTQSGSLARRMAGDERLIGIIRAARRNPRVRAVILHVDSPGGSALASDRIHHELSCLAAEKPLVACLADVAASGGYYVAAAAHTIIARPTTITGSIGVVAARLVLGPLFARLGVVTQTVKRGARADMLDLAHTMTDDERAALERELEGVYRGFVKVVAAGRKRPEEEIARVAEGRVWSGVDAQAHKLVDSLGGFEEAVAAARSRASATTKKPHLLRPVVLRTPWRSAVPLDPPAQKAARAAFAMVDGVAASIGIDLDAIGLASRGERVLAWSPVASASLETGSRDDD